jgi:hypothetical protein
VKGAWIEQMESEGLECCGSTQLSLSNAQWVCGCFGGLVIQSGVQPPQSKEAAFRLLLYRASISIQESPAIRR